jgi:hypothetical protein
LFLGGATKTRLSRLVDSFIFALSALNAVYRNRIVLNNIDKLQNINGDKWNANSNLWLK